MISVHFKHGFFIYSSLNFLDVMSKNYLRSKIKNLAGNVSESISNENIDQFIVLLGIRKGTKSLI